MSLSGSPKPAGTSSNSRKQSDRKLAPPRRSAYPAPILKSDLELFRNCAATCSDATGFPTLEWRSYHRQHRNGIALKSSQFKVSFWHFCDTQRRELDDRFQPGS
jgi:hypothetical protein